MKPQSSLRSLLVAAGSSLLALSSSHAATLYWDGTSATANADEIVWLQEEPENMGAWNHIKGRLYEAHDDTHEIRRVSRQESASPATGSHAIHLAEVHDLMESALGGI